MLEIPKQPFSATSARLGSHPSPSSHKAPQNPEPIPADQVQLSSGPTTPLIPHSTHSNTVETHLHPSLVSLSSPTTPTPLNDAACQATPSRAPQTIALEAPLPLPASSQGLVFASGQLGAGFPSAPAETNRSLIDRLQDWAASSDKLGLYSKAVNFILGRVSEATDRNIGVDLAGLLSVERTLYKSLAAGTEGSNGSAPTVPLFKALADGQASYVSLSPERQSEANHMMLLYNGLGPEKLKSIEFEDPSLSKVRDYLVAKAERKEFPVFVDIDGQPDSFNSTESIATGCITSIAKRENSLGTAFPDPKQYYNWLLTRVESNYKKLDPWLFATQKTLHNQVVDIKENLTPRWLEAPTKGHFNKKPTGNHDPFGARPSVKKIQAAYQGFMEVSGNGQAPTWETLSQIADTVVNLDRDLLTGVQTYWIKLLSEVSRDQRQSMMAPVARAWANLTTLGPDHAEFDRVAPASAPKIELIDSHSGQRQLEPYDRALALSQAVDHMINGLGITERKQFLDLLLDELRPHEPQVEAREARLRQQLGQAYAGLDIKALFSGKEDIRTPGVREALAQLRKASHPELATHQRSPELAEITRHRDLMEWIATRYSRYGDSAFDWVKATKNTEEFREHPLLVSEYYTPSEIGQKSGVTPLPPLANASKGKLLGSVSAGGDPMKVSMVFEGGGGRGFAYAEALKQLESTLSQGTGQLQVDEYVGNSAGAITAGLLAAGYQANEISQVLEQLDFKSFYSDYLWLAGGVDPKVRGINRSGLFSMQKMYQALSNLLQAKCGVEGRPVLFRDLPFKLKITSTMANGDIPDKLRDQLQLAPDGGIVFSDTTTPNMDVAGAICASAAIPGFFNAPQLQAFSGINDGKPELTRLQTVDGGTVNNFPIAEAGQDGKSCFVMLPVSYQAPSPTPGGQPLTLGLLDFDTANLGPIDAYNEKNFHRFTPTLKETVNAFKDQGYQRLVIGLNLTKLKEQDAPVIQGTSREETLSLLKTSQDHHLPVLDAEAGAKVVKSNLRAKPHGLVERVLLNELMDKDDVFKPAGPNPHFNPSKQEADGITDILAGVVAASMTAPTLTDRRVFEKA